MLRGASAEARSELAGRLDGVSAGDAGTLGAELFGVATLLRREPALRRVATDASIEGAAKAGLAESVLGDAVSKPTLDLVQDAVRRRWTSPRDLADVLEHLGTVAAVRSAGDDAGQVSDQLFAIQRLVDTNPTLRGALSDPARTSTDRTKLLTGLLDGKVSAATLLIVEQATSGVHGPVDRALQEFQHTAAQAIGEQIATVHSARDLSDDERRRLTEALSQQYDASVHLQVLVDPEVVGGLRVAIGDDVIDGTVASKLEDAQRKLAG
jgi:F-type H+-transporting ATPase subunit delta